MKRLFLFLTLASVMFIAGCITVQKANMERVDQQIEGNQGYITGQSPSTPETMGRQREVIRIDIELPTKEEVKEKLDRTFSVE